MPPLTQPQAVALQLAMASSDGAVAYTRTFLNGNASRKISVSTAKKLAALGYGYLTKGKIHYEGVFTVGPAGREAYLKHKEKISMSKETEDRYTNVLVPHREEPEYVELYPEDVKIDFPPGHPLHDDRAYLPVDMALYNSIHTEGLRVEPVVRRSPENPEEFEIIDGRGRIKAARFFNASLGKASQLHKKVRCKIERAASNDLEAARLKHLYNEARNNRDALGRYAGMVEMKKFGMNRDEIASLFKVDVKTVSRASTIMSSSDELKQALRDGKLSVHKAMALAQLPNDQQPEAVAAYVATLEELETAEVANDTGDGDGDGKDKPTERPTKKKARRVMPWRNVAPLLSKVKKGHYRDNKATRTDADIAAAVELTIEYLTGGSKKKSAEFEKLLEEIGLVEEEAEAAE